MKKFLKNYWFILCMLAGIVGGCLVGAFAPGFGARSNSWARCSST